MHQDSIEFNGNGPLPEAGSTGTIEEPGWGEIQPVGGRFGIAATLPTTQHVIDYEEGNLKLPQGYYRLVTHPCAQALQESLKEFYGVRHALLFPSLAAAVTEYIDYLAVSRPDLTVMVLQEPDTDLEVSTIASAAFAEVREVAVQADLEAALPAASLTHQSLVLFNLRDVSSRCQAEAEWFAQARKQRAVLAGVSFLPPKKDWPPAQLPHWFCGLGQPAHGIEGGAHLTQVDLQADEIRERQKKRGPILSARNAAVFLGELIPEHYATTIETLEQDLCARLAKLDRAEFALLFPSGMNAIAACFDLAHARQRRKIIVFGHMYSDTHMLLEETPWPGGDRFETHFLDADADDLLQTLLDETTGCVFVETITNPLNQVPHLPRILAACKQHGVPVVVDNTLATPTGCQPLTLGADVVVYSTSKHLSGKNNHGGGLLLTNDPELRDWFSDYRDGRGLRMSGLEMATLRDNLQDVMTRLPRFHANAQTLAEALNGCPLVDQIYYAGLPDNPWHANAEDILQACGSVVGFTLNEKGLAAMRRVYDADMPHVTKSPSLGSNHTLLCPYTMLTYYQRSDEYLVDIGLERHLLRVAVGCEEDFQPVLNELIHAIS